MSINLVRKQVGANTGGEFTIDNDRIKLNTALGTALTTIEVYGGSTGRSGGTWFKSSDSSLAFAIYGATTDSATNPFSIGTTSNHGFRFLANSTQAGVVGTDLSWTLGANAPSDLTPALRLYPSGVGTNNFTFAKMGLANGSSQITIADRYSAGGIWFGTNAEPKGFGSDSWGNTNSSFGSGVFGGSRGIPFAAYVANSGSSTGGFASFFTPVLLSDSVGQFTIGPPTGSGIGSVAVHTVTGNTAIELKLKSAGGAGSLMRFQDNMNADSILGHINTTGQLQARTGASGGVTLTNGATSWTAISDERLKENIVALNYGLSEVMQLEPKSFNYISDNESDPRRIGLIAQQVKEIMPEFVFGSENEGDRYTLDLTNMVPVLIKAIKELKTELDEYKAEHP